MPLPLEGAPPDGPTEADVASINLTDAARHEWSVMVDDWCAAMRNRGLTEGTIYHRVRILGIWHDFTLPLGGPFSRHTTWRTVEAFVSNRGAARRRYDLISHLHMFYRYAQRAGHSEHDPTELAERPKLTPRLPRPINDTDLALAVIVAPATMRAALLLAAGSGLRCIEIARLRWEDVGTDAVRVRGKGNRERIVPLHPTTLDALYSLDRPTEWVVPWRLSSFDDTGRNVSRTINLYLRSVGVRATAHQLRHWCATKALAASGDLRAVQDLLGHASPATTAIYAALDPTRLADVVNRIPIDQLINEDDIVNSPHQSAPSSIGSTVSGEQTSTSA